MERKSVKTAVIVLSGCLILAGLFGIFFIVREVDKPPITIADVLDVDLIILPKEAESFASRFVVADVKNLLYLPPEILDQLRSDPKIEKLTYHVQLGKPPSDCCTYIDGPIIAFEEKSDFILTPLIAQRRTNKPLAGNEVLEGGAINDYLGLITDILLFNNNIKIVGHLKHSDTNFDNCVFMRIEDVAAISPEYRPDFPPGSVSVIFLQLNPAVNISEFVEQIKNSYPYISTISKGSLED